MNRSSFGLKDQERLYLRANLDPGAILEAQGLTPDPWQRRFLSSTAKRVLLCASRQCGKSTSTAALAVRNLVFVPGSDTLVIAPSMRQAEELYRKVVGAFEAFAAPIPVASQTSKGLVLKNGSRCLCVPGTERSARGFSAPELVILDEAARIRDETFEALSPLFASNPAGRLIALSTPYGSSGWFANAWHGQGEDWEKFQVPATEVTRISAEFLDRERRALGEKFFGQEYLCDFGRSSSKNPALGDYPIVKAFIGEMFT